MTEFTDAESFHAFNAGIVDEFRANGGKVGGSFEGGNLLLLHTTGAKSGQPRMSPLAYLPVDGRILIVGSKAGADTHPDWVHNLRANPGARIEIGTDGASEATGKIDAYDVVARELPTDEREATYPLITAVAPVFADYQAKTSRVIPLFELVRA